MKKKILNYSPFERYHGSGSLIFVKPLGSKLFRLFEGGIPVQVFDILYEHGQLIKNVFVFKQDGYFMQGLCAQIAEMGVPAAVLEDGDKEALN